MQLPRKSTLSRAMRRDRPIGQVLGRPLLFYTPIVVFLLVTLAPIYWIVLSAFTPINELFEAWS